MGRFALGRCYASKPGVVVTIVSVALHVELYDGYLSMVWPCTLPRDEWVSRVTPIVADGGWPDGLAVAYRDKHERSTVPEAMAGDLDGVTFLRLELPDRTLIWDGEDGTFAVIAPAMDDVCDRLLRATR